MLYDKDIREPLFLFLEGKYGKVRFLEEHDMGKSRADVLMVTESALFGVEIKSDADSYARLASQVRDYDRYCDFNMAVVGASHGKHIEEHVPAYWGIITVNEGEDLPEFTVCREPKLNPKAKLKNKLSFLWRPELAALQEMNRMPKYREKSKKFVIDRIQERVPEKIPRECIDRQISELLFERDYTTIAAQIREYKKSVRSASGNKIKVERRR